MGIYTSKCVFKVNNIDTQDTYMDFVLMLLT